MAVEMVTALLWPAFVGLAILAGPFILRVYGERWVPAAVPLAMLAVASAIQVSITMTWEVFVACGELRTQTRIEFIRAGASLAMFIAGCAVSLPAAAATRIADALVAVLLYRGHLQRMTDTTFADFLPVYVRSGILTGLAVLPAAALMIIYKGSATTPLALAIATIAAGVVLWILGLVLLKHRLLAEAVSWLSRREVQPGAAAS
jgi:O-antigen/teichoic acid export membrane protein